MTKHGSIVLSTTLIIAIGCKSTALRSPDAETTPAAQSRWALDYKSGLGLVANKEPEKACPLFAGLAKEENFPAKTLAELRARQTCKDRAEQPFDISQYPSFMKDLALDISLELAEKSQNKTTLMNLSAEKSKQRLPQKDKITWVRKSMALAKELKLKDKAAEFEKRLYSIAPRLNPQPQVSDWLEVAMDYRSHREFGRANAYYEKIISKKGLPIEDKIAAFKGLRLSFKNARNMDAHIETCKRFVNYLDKTMKLNPRSQMVREAYYDAQTFYARALWTQGKSQEARAVFDLIEKNLKGKISLAELYWLKGRMAEEDSKFDEVSGFMQLALDEQNRNAELRDKILWNSAWNERRRKDLNKTVSLLKELDDRTQSEFTRVRTLYWLGRTYAENKQESEAKETFTRLIDLDPLGYYGLLARRQLDMNITFTLGAKEKIQEEPQLPIDRPLVEWLMVLNETELLTNLLDQTSMAYKKQTDQNDDGWIAIFKLYARGGLYMKLYESLGSLAPDRRKNILESHPELLFPQPWYDQVQTASLQYGVREELIYAIMRQESAFNPRARSIADAFGLMQVLPEVADRMNSEHKLGYAQMDDLYDPQINIHVGAAHLRELLKRNKDQFILAVASYNANEKAIRKWMQTRYRGDALEFIEEIPYEETRTYVRLVMRNLIYYSLLKSKSAAIEFPSWVLTLDAT